LLAVLEELTHFDDVEAKKPPQPDVWEVLIAFNPSIDGSPTSSESEVGSQADPHRVAAAPEDRVGPSAPPPADTARHVPCPAGLNTPGLALFLSDFIRESRRKNVHTHWYAMVVADGMSPRLSRQLTTEPGCWRTQENESVQRGALPDGARREARPQKWVLNRTLVLAAMRQLI
jgi:hypothetical protein